MRANIVSLFIAVICATSVQAQVLCVNCYDQNAQVNTGANLVLNGSFENHDCGVWPGFWDVYCPSSGSYTCDIQNWTCTGGGAATYTLIFDATTTTVPDGLVAAYMGNAFAEFCGAVEDTSCLVTTGCVVTGIPAGFPTNEADYGGGAGVSIHQAVSGLTVGSAYVLEFWAGGEAFSLPGVFAVDIGFGNIFLHCKPTTPGAIGTRYEIVFQATSATHTIKFTNWGHMSSSCSEVIVDDVRLMETASQPTADFTIDQTGCGFTVNFINESTGGGAPFLWTMGDGTTYTTTDVTHTYTTPGTYTVTLTLSGGGCGVGGDTLSQTVTVAEPIAIEALFTAVQEDQCSGLNVVTTNLSTGPAGMVYTWDMGDGTIIVGSTAAHTYNEVGSYTITLTAYDPICDETDDFEVNVVVLPSPLVNQDIVVPNIFSPNKDGLNDEFFPIEGAGSNVTLTVWNRWGIKMFETSGAYKPWNGRTPGNKPVPDGVYFYILEYKIPCTGSHIEGKEEGYVHVVGSTL